MKYSIFIFIVFSSWVANGAVEAWTATKTVEISFSEIVLDGGRARPVKCPHNKKSDVAKLTVSATTLPVSCADDYLGGFFIGDEILAQKDADAGDTWDKQSLIFRDERSQSLILAQVTYSTYDPSSECEGVSKGDLKKQNWSDQKIKDCFAGKVECKKTEKFLKWNEQGHKFEEIQFKGKVPIRKLQPFENYRRHC